MRWDLSRMLLKVIKLLLLQPISTECEATSGAVRRPSQPRSTNSTESIHQHLRCHRCINSCTQLDLSSSLPPQDKNRLLRLSLLTILSRMCNQEGLAKFTEAQTSRTSLSSSQTRFTLLVEVLIKVSSRLDTKVAYNTTRSLLRVKKEEDPTVWHFKRLMWVADNSIQRATTMLLLYHQAFHPALWTSHLADPNHSSSVSLPRAIEATTLRDSWPPMSGPSQGCSLL